MQKSGWVIVGLLHVLGAAAPVKAELPADLEDLKTRHGEEGKTPEGLCKLWFDACFVYMNEDTRDEGRKMIQYLTIPLKKTDNWDETRDQHYFVRALTEQQHIIRSYAKGTSPDNQYQMDPQDYELNVLRINWDPPGKAQRGIQVYLKSSGADTPRPVYLKQSTATNLWYMNAHTNVYTGIRPPKNPDDEEFK